MSVVVWNLPSSTLKDDALGHRSTSATGLNQNWGVFSPDHAPSLDVPVRPRALCRRKRVLSPPRGGRLVGGYWDYRWRKWAEWTSTDEHSELWQPGGRLVRPARRAQGREPVSVTLVRRWRELLPPGPGPSGASGRSTPSTPTRLPARRRRRRDDEGGRDLGAVLVQRRRDVHPRALPDRLRARRGRLDDLPRPGAVLVLRGDGILPGIPTPTPAPGASSSSTRARRRHGRLPASPRGRAVSRVRLQGLAAVVVFVCLVSFARRDPGC